MLTLLYALAAALAALPYALIVLDLWRRRHP